MEMDMKIDMRLKAHGLTPLMASRMCTPSISEVLTAITKLGARNMSPAGETEARLMQAEENDPAAPHGRVFAYIDSQMAFFVSIFTCLIHAVENLFLAVIFSFTMPCSEDGWNFCIAHFYRTAIDLNCARIAFIGTFLPLEAKESFEVMMKGMNDFVR